MRIARRWQRWGRGCAGYNRRSVIDRIREIGSGRPTCNFFGWGVGHLSPDRGLATPDDGRRGRHGKVLAGYTTYLVTALRTSPGRLSAQPGPGRRPRQIDNQAPRAARWRPISAAKRSCPRSGPYARVSRVYHASQAVCLRRVPAPRTWRRREKTLAAWVTPQSLVRVYRPPPQALAPPYMAATATAPTMEGVFPHNVRKSYARGWRQHWAQ